MAASSSWDRGRRSCPSGPRRPSGPGRAGPRRAGPGRARLPHHMGLLDYYRQFEAIGEEEINRELRERRRREHAVAIEWVPGARPRRYRVARPSERGGRERLDLRGPRAGQRLPRPPCHPAAAQTGRPPRCRARADRGRQRRRRAAPDGGARVARARRRARHAMALLSALSAHGPACGRPAGGRRAVDRRRRPRGGPRRNDRPYPRGDDLQPQRPDRHVPRGEPPGRAARGRVHVLLDEAWRSSRTSRTATPGSRSSRPSHGCSCFGPSRRSTACPGCGRATSSARRRPAECSSRWRRRSGSTRSARPRPSRRSRSATVRSTGARARRTHAPAQGAGLHAGRCPAEPGQLRMVARD